MCGLVRTELTQFYSDPVRREFSLGEELFEFGDDAVYPSDQTWYPIYRHTGPLFLTGLDFLTRSLATWFVRPE